MEAFVVGDTTIENPWDKALCFVHIEYAQVLPAYALLHEKQEIVNYAVVCICTFLLQSLMES